MEKNRDEKTVLRNQIRKRRNQITPSEKQQWDEAICRQFFYQFENNDSLSVQNQVYLYMDFRNEAGTFLILQELWRRGIKTAVPKTQGQQLSFYEIRSLEQLDSGYMGIPEPKAGLLRATEEQALVVVPGVAFDQKGFRIGYGGGFYDRFFAREPRHPRWALAYDFQLLEAVPYESWDQQMDLLITPKHVWRGRGKGRGAG